MNDIPRLEFDVLIDEAFVDLAKEIPRESFALKRVLSLINDFEDGEWRYDKFHQFLWNNIAETALTQRERASLAGKPRSLLVAAAKNLRLSKGDSDNTKGSELAEVVLYGIMKHHYGALPVVPKIFHKQNTQDYAKGADSVHIVIDQSSDFSLWFGEAKFYNSIENSRLDHVISSVNESLRTDKLRKENSLITNLEDLDLLVTDPVLNASIRETLALKTSIDSIKPRLQIPILLLHECNITKGTHLLTDEYKKKIIKYHIDRATAYFKKQVKIMKDVSLYSEIRFHLILFPLPAKTTVVNRFIKSVKELRS